MSAANDLERIGECHNIKQLAGQVGDRLPFSEQAIEELSLV